MSTSLKSIIVKCLPLYDSNYRSNEMKSLVPKTSSSRASNVHQNRSISVFAIVFLVTLLMSYTIHRGSYMNAPLFADIEDLT